MFSIIFVTKSQLDIEKTIHNSIEHFGFDGVHSFPIYESLYHDAKEFTLNISPHQLQFIIAERSMDELEPLLNSIEEFLSDNFSNEVIGVRYPDVIGDARFNQIENVNVFRFH